MIQKIRSFVNVVDGYNGIMVYIIISYIGYGPPPRIPVTTRIITFLVGDPYKPSFATVTGREDNPKYHILYGDILGLIKGVSKKKVTPI